ncbi:MULTISPECIES: chemotaxis protein CheD [Brevibacillus]|jgi:chemotaxis protein CheD|uniref:Probable chemoreceptor glutamine deamidase CheD n=1 Tax=Brevibacillus borstelensis AK1 TaxID=1300222 RepID=M8DL19_9BACL|nr:chemotaxis protein CheD [Brevibacillus borstelensis]EMT54167.1 chemotaxis protein CheD [Brevibacillus borstelensis AK1]KKX53992.1 chemotaxis protein CheD [Brevibacillus borstelensis cifa_chp40]MBE5398016.1 chemotaxis protein CheD [Brevibacillus borstelensis]MCC0563469.1 chemotaxis protein CheD [Brevibacillus borstelensis]MCM3470040.1 chemotaxis protein CheD [Brevibacillus borstelensis]
MEIIKIGMADLGVAKSPDRLRTTGLGSCVGVVLYDSVHKVAGMAHVMLPESSLGKGGEIAIGKYADTAIPRLIQDMKLAGASTTNMVAKLAGGAQMFAFLGKSDSMRIGPRNVEACKMALQQAKIKVVAEDTGGNCGRTIEFDAATGLLQIRTVNQGVKEV